MLAETLKGAHVRRPDLDLPWAERGQQLQGYVQGHNPALSPGHLTQSRLQTCVEPLRDGRRGSWRAGAGLTVYLPL